MLRERRRAIKLTAIDEGRFDRQTGAKFREKAPSRFAEAFDLDASRASFDQNVSRATPKIDFAERVVVGIKYRVPYEVRRIFQPQQSERRMGNEANPDLAFSIDRADLRDIERRNIGGVERAVHGPFQFRDVSEISDRSGRRKGTQKFGKFATI